MPSPQTGPLVGVPGLLSPALTSPGYSGAHRSYLTNRGAQARRVFTPVPAMLPKEVYTLKYQVKCQYGGRATAKVVFVCQVYILIMSL